MTGLASFLRFLASAILPGGGFFSGVFSPATVLALYWVDNLVGAVCMTVRIFAHRRQTGARGHHRAQLGATYRLGDAKQGPERAFRSFLAEFAMTSVAFVVAHGLFLAVVLYGLLDEPPDSDRLRQGVIGIILLQLGGLAVDLTHIGAWPFARIKHQTVGIISRIVLVHVAILGGMVFFAMRGTPWAFFSVFVVLKALADLGSRLPEPDRDKPPRWLALVMNLLPRRKGETFDEYWRRSRAAEIQQENEDEEEMPAKPGGTDLDRQAR
jgi:hypothetical protein